MLPVEAVHTSCAYPRPPEVQTVGFCFRTENFETSISDSNFHKYTTFLRNEYGECHLRIKGYGNLYLIALRQEKYYRRWDVWNQRIFEESCEDISCIFIDQVFRETFRGTTSIGNLGNWRAYWIWISDNGKVNTIIQKSPKRLQRNQVCVSYRGVQ